MKTHIEYADKIFKDPRSISGDFLSAFNCAIQGDSRLDVVGYPHPPYTYGDRTAGYERARKMINAGEIYYRHIFPHGCKHKSFSYGGSHVCNECGRNNLAKPWWNIRIFQDGDAWCVVGEGFQNLQESDNYAFGDTEEEALAAYQKLMETPNDQIQ